jgi:hypothetical protein
MPDTGPEDTPKDTIDWPGWWFFRLEAAVERGDHQAAAEAQRELDRLGVRVAYGRPNAKRQGVRRGR